MQAFRSLFGALPDPRAANARHDLAEILLISFAATLCGAQTCVDIAEFAQAKEAMLRTIMRLEHGPPSHDTISRVFRLLDADAFEAVFRRFMAAFSATLEGFPGGVVALDGKSLSGACEASARTTPLHLVCAFAAKHRLVLGQRRAPGRSETKAALELVALLDLKGSIVTADALHGTRKMTAAIRRRGGAYALALKGNRGPLFGAAKTLFEEAPDVPKAVTEEHRHGRKESRQAQVLKVPPDWAKRFQFEDLTAIARIESVRSRAAREERITRFFVLSRRFSPAQALRIVRTHWDIENKLHWVLDVVLAEDASRSRKDHAGENLALLRRLALNLLQTDTYKASIRRKIKRAGWQDAYLFSLLSQMR
jgi:predicted transposase YbfD/YdcC